VRIEENQAASEGKQPKMGTEATAVAFLPCAAFTSRTWPTLPPHDYIPGTSTRISSPKFCAAGCDLASSIHHGPRGWTYFWTDVNYFPFFLANFQTCNTLMSYHSLKRWMINALAKFCKSPNRWETNSRLGYFSSYCEFSAGHIFFILHKQNFKLETSWL
jgi:hypothetical protein